MIRALIFDVDGTLAETEEAHRQAFNETFAEHGLDWNWSRDDYRRLLAITGGKERMRRHREEIGTAEPPDHRITEIHADKTTRYGRLIASGAVGLRQGVADLVDEARASGVRLAVATTTNRHNVEALTLAAWGCPAGEVFEVIAAGDEVARKKPFPDVYQLALERLGMPPEAAVALEDSANGLTSALGAGLRVAVTPSDFTDHEDYSSATWVLPSLSLTDRPVELRFS